MGKLTNGFIGFLTLLYPLAVYFGIRYIEPWHIATMLLALLFIRLITSKTNLKWNRALIWLAIVYCGLAIWNNNLITLRFYPVLISLGLFIIFFSSLFYPPPIIEKFARLQHPDLPEQGVLYTRIVTQVWCVFFVVNGMMATITAIWCSFEWWSLYNGLISYLLIGTVMGIEYLVRIRTLEHVQR